ncbi:hypothetical protein BCR42DRAFT_468136 [Absidia repens]|uniref:Uncharacterized protein n=1 Tax=Absidia repens TaxID=90262 RepID=A0A1X2I9W1_9FUNG|nr:hypothetical protein BCR42DRAFT_468136 [Absidia repens]
MLSSDQVIAPLPLNNRKIINRLKQDKALRLSSIQTRSEPCNSCGGTEVQPSHYSPTSHIHGQLCGYFFLNFADSQKPFCGLQGRQNRSWVSAKTCHTVDVLLVRQKHHSELPDLSMGDFTSNDLDQHFQLWGDVDPGMKDIFTATDGADNIGGSISIPIKKKNDGTPYHELQTITMNSIWILTNEEQLGYLEAMATQHFAGYEAHVFSEREHFWAKAATMTNYLVPTLLEYVHLKINRPTNTLEIMAYRLEKRRLVNNLLQGPDNRRNVNTVLRRLALADDWEQDAGAALLGEGHADAGLDLANVFVNSGEKYNRKSGTQAQTSRSMQIVSDVNLFPSHPKIPLLAVGVAPSQLPCVDLYLE